MLEVIHQIDHFILKLKSLKNPVKIKDFVAHDDLKAIELNIEWDALKKAFKKAMMGNLMVVIIDL